MAERGSALLVGIDIGTTLTKAAVVGADGRELAWAQSPTPWRPLPTGAECDADLLFDSVMGTLRRALEGVAPRPVAGLGVTSMAETVVRLGDDGYPVGPCIAWHDTRGDQEAAALATTFGADAFSRRSGLAPTRMCTIAKLAWSSQHGGPRYRHALSVADWVVHRLGGGRFSEASLASRTGALSLGARTWWGEGLEWAGAPRDVFPEVVQAGHRAGTVTASLRGSNAQVLERLAGAALTCAGHDHLCAAVGAGAVGPGKVFDSCGTAEALVRGTAPLPEDAVLEAVRAGINVGWHTVAGQQALLAGHSLGLLLDRVLRLLGVKGEEAVASLDRVALGCTAGTLRVVQGGPFDEPSITGLHHDASPAALWSAAIDAVAASAARTVRRMQEIAGPATELVLSGGWAHLAGLRRRKAGLLGELRWPAVVEAGARGAALFGGSAAGMFDLPSNFPPPDDNYLERSDAEDNQ